MRAKWDALLSELCGGSDDPDAGRLANEIEREVRAIEADRRSLAERVEKLSQPEWFYSAEDPERSGGDVQDVVDDMDHEGVMEVAGAREVWKKWVAIRCLTVDDEGDVDDTEAATFDTVEEAERCWPESLAAAALAAIAKATGEAK